MADENLKLFLREIWHADDTRKLSLGHENFAVLKAFLREDAYQFHQENIAKTFVYAGSSEIIDNARIYGYV